MYKCLQIFTAQTNINLIKTYSVYSRQMNAEPITNVCTAIKFTLPFNRISYYIIPYSILSREKSININFANIISYKNIFILNIVRRKLIWFYSLLKITYYYGKVNIINLSLHTKLPEQNRIVDLVRFGSFLRVFKMEVLNLL